MLDVRLYPNGIYDKSGGSAFPCEALPRVGDYVFLGPNRNQLGYTVKGVLWVEGSSQAHVVLEPAKNLPAWAHG